MNRTIISVILLSIGICATWILSSCSSDGPQAIKYGKDQCAYCKMTVSDARFGTQLKTKKGRAYHFDDQQCMVAMVKKGEIAKEDVAVFYMPDYANDNKLLAAEGLFYLHSESLKSPMRGDVAAFQHQEDLEETLLHHEGKVMTWEDLWK